MKYRADVAGRDKPGERPVFHIWTSHDAPWLEDGEAAQHFPEWQPGR